MFAGMNEMERMFGAMDLLRRRLDRLYSDVDRSADYYPRLPFAGNTLRTNLLENGDMLEIRAEVPGVSKDDLTIKVQGNYLEISGNRSADAPEGYNVHRRERRTTTFSRSFTLPADIDTDKVDATLKNGILYLYLPKSETARPKQITIH